MFSDAGIMPRPSKMIFNLKSFDLPEFDAKIDFSAEKKCSKNILQHLRFPIWNYLYFPELLYAGFLANIMSPLIWKWRYLSWFKDIDKLNEMQKINRIKQFIIDNYNFNLDLETWGLTDKKTETARFKSFVDMDTLKQSNALLAMKATNIISI